MQEYGDAKLVSGNTVDNVEQLSAIVENEEEKNALDTQENSSLVSNENETAISDNQSNIASNESIVPNDENNTLQTNSQINAKENDEYFTKSRLERDTMYSQMLETYQKILENSQIANDQKSIAQTEIKRINHLKNAIMICENLIKTKGFEDVIIFVNDKSISVIIKKDNLEAQKIAQIQNIVVRELNAEIDDVHISTK